MIQMYPRTPDAKRPSSDLFAGGTGVRGATARRLSAALLGLARTTTATLLRRALGGTVLGSPVRTPGLRTSGIRALSPRSGIRALIPATGGASP